MPALLKQNLQYAKECLLYFRIVGSGQHLNMLGYTGVPGIKLHLAKIEKSAFILVVYLVVIPNSHVSLTMPCVECVGTITVGAVFKERD